MVDPKYDSVRQLIQQARLGIVAHRRAATSRDLESGMLHKLQLAHDRLNEALFWVQNVAGYPDADLGKEP